MLNYLIEKMEELLAEKMCNGFDHAVISVSDLRSLLDAAKALLEVHEMADGGELDGIDLEWMVRVDSMVLGADEQSESKETI